MVKGEEFSNVVHYLSNQYPTAKMKDWRRKRDKFLRDLGLGGFYKPDGAKSKTIPDWWGADSIAWFKTPEDELAFRLKWIK